MKADDPFNGQWVALRGSFTNEGAWLQFTPAPLGTLEIPGAQQTNQPFRLTYKLRIQGAQTLAIEGLEVFSGAITREARLRFEWGLPARVPGSWVPVFEARNGRILGTTRTRKNSAIVRVEYADSADPSSADRGIVVCRSGETHSFGVFIDEVLREGGVRVPDVGAFVSNADRGFTSDTWPQRSQQDWAGGTVAARVATLPEQSFAQVEKAIPLKAPHELFLGVPDLRQEIGLEPNGDVVLWGDSLRSPGSDADARPWRWPKLDYEFASGDQPRFGSVAPRQVKRWLEEGWLPVVHHSWSDQDIGFEETCVAVPLKEPIASLKSQHGTETVAGVLRFALTNTASTTRRASLWLALSHPSPWHLGVDGTLLLREPSRGRTAAGSVPVRGRINTLRRGALDLVVVQPGAKPGPARDAVRYQVELAGGEGHAIEMVVPYTELLDVEEAAALRTLHFTNALAQVSDYWHERTLRGMTYEVPDRYLNEFFKANLWHVLISTDLDPVTGLAEHGAATHEYGVYANETAMVARSLEMRSEHQEAWRLLEPFLRSQGKKALPGNFHDQKGVLYAAYPDTPDPYTAQGYNLHHGCCLAALAEHYFWTRDSARFLGYAGQLIDAADWVISERQATCQPRRDGSKPIEYGLLPAGQLEDVEEYQYFYAVDAYASLGLKRTAQALTAVRRDGGGIHTGSGALAVEVTKAAERLTAASASFVADIRASVAESVASSPLVRLRDGDYIPYIPPRAHALTHLTEGWIREALYGPLHLVNAEVYEPNHPFVDWVIDDLEDNIFLSRESGFGITNAEANFFDQGGFTQQPNLLDLAVTYLERDQVPNFLRAFYNTAWASLYPDAMCFAEWLPELGKGGGPLYKTPDECRFVQWMRQMLILERGDSLELGLGVPRAWMKDGQRVKVQRAATWFGRLDLEIASQANQGRILATLTLSPTAAPAAIHLRLRHPIGLPIRSATVNGKSVRVDDRRQLISLPVNATSWQVEGRF